MRKGEKKILQENMDLLIKQTDDKTLSLQLWNSGVISEEAYNKIRGIQDENERKRQLYIEIMDSPSRESCLCNLIEGLVKTGHFDLAKKLKPDINIESYFNANSNRSNDDPVDDINYYMHHMSLLPTPLTIKVRHAEIRWDLRDSLFRSYEMGSRPKGYLLIINNVEFVNNIHDEREGAIVDENNLKELFKQLGFEVIAHRNQGLQDMLRKINEFKEMKELKIVNCIFIAILSHGNAAPRSINDTVVISSDGHNILCSDIYNRFSNQECPQLLNIPKVFIFQSCRGDLLDFGLRNFPQRSRTHQDGRGVVDDLKQPVRYPRTITDMLIAYATLPGYKANRDIKLGTWYINKLCEVFMEHAKDQHVEDLFKLVDLRLSEMRSESGNHQTSMYENRGFRHLFLSPGLDDYTPTESKPNSNS